MASCVIIRDNESNRAIKIRPLKWEDILEQASSLMRAPEYNIALKELKSGEVINSEKKYDDLCAAPEPVELVIEIVDQKEEDELSAPSIQVVSQTTAFQQEETTQMNAPQQEETTQRPAWNGEALLIGLEGTGKSTFLQLVSNNDAKPGQHGDLEGGLTWNGIALIIKEFKDSIEEAFRISPRLIIVVDSTDTVKLEQAKAHVEQIKEIIGRDHNSPKLLFYANKQDLPDSKNVADLVDTLGLHSLRSCEWYIQASCFTHGDGVYEGLNWLTNN